MAFVVPWSGTAASRSTRPGTASSPVSTGRHARSGCAEALVGDLAELGIEIRAGVHTGECERVDGTVAGLAVHIGERIAAHAGRGEVLVSRTVRDLVVGSGLSFASRGDVELKGVPGEWELFALQPTQPLLPV